MLVHFVHFGKLLMTNLCISCTCDSCNGIKLCNLHLLFGDIFHFANSPFQIFSILCKCNLCKGIMFCSCRLLKCISFRLGIIFVRYHNVRFRILLSGVKSDFLPFQSDFLIHMKSFVELERINRIFIFLFLINIIGRYHC